RAFRVVRAKAPDGTQAPAFQTWYSRLDRTVRARDIDSMLGVLTERPGEFARRFDHALRVAGDDAARDRIVGTFANEIPSLALRCCSLSSATSPLASGRPTFASTGPRRVAKGVSSTDERATLPSRAIEPAVRAIEAERLHRIAPKQ